MERYPTEYDGLIGKTITGVCETEDGVQFLFSDWSSATIVRESWGDGVQLGELGEIDAHQNNDGWIDELISEHPYGAVLGADYYIQKHLRRLVQFGLIDAEYIAHVERRISEWRNAAEEYRNGELVKAAVATLEAIHAKYWGDGR